MAPAQKAQRERETAEPSNFPWERLPDESPQAFARFLAYRSQEPGSRSMRSLGVSPTLAFRWARKHQWTKRTSAYDAWVCQLSDATANHAVLYHRQAVVRFGSLSLAKASATVTKLDEAKLSADEAIALAVNGAKLSRQALGIADAVTVADRAPVAQVAVSFGSISNGSAPPWLTGQTERNETKLIETKQNEVLVPCGEQVIARPPLIASGARLAERKVNCPKGKV